MEKQSAQKVHPLVAAAAISVILVSLLALARLTGMLGPVNGMLAPFAGAPAPLLVSRTAAVTPLNVLPTRTQRTQPAPPVAQASPPQGRVDAPAGARRDPSPDDVARALALDLPATQDARDPRGVAVGTVGAAGNADIRPAAQQR